MEVGQSLWREIRRSSLPRPYRDGATPIVLGPLDLMARLAALGTIARRDGRRILVERHSAEVSGQQRI
jgi:hypothetical protein